MFHDRATMGPTGEFTDGPEPPLWRRLVRDMVENLSVNHFNLVGDAAPEEITAWHNRVQGVALSTHLGMPVALSSDPRHHFTENGPRR